MAYPPCVCGDMPAMHLEKRYLGLVSRTDVELVRPHTYHAKGDDDRSLLRASPSLEEIYRDKVGAAVDEYINLMNFVALEEQRHHTHLLLKEVPTLRAHVDAGCWIFRDDAELRRYDVAFVSTDESFYEWDIEGIGEYLDDLDDPNTGFWCKDHSIRLDDELNPA